MKEKRREATKVAIGATCTGSLSFSHSTFHGHRKERSGLTRWAPKQNDEKSTYPERKKLNIGRCLATMCKEDTTEDTRLKGNASPTQHFPIKPHPDFSWFERKTSDRNGARAGISRQISEGLPSAPAQKF